METSFSSLECEMDTDPYNTESECSENDIPTNAKLAVREQYLIRYELLLPLFERCQTCGQMNIYFDANHKGCVLLIKTNCINDHKNTWRSQSLINKQYVGNVQLSAAIYFSGIGFTAFEIFADTLGLKFFSHTAYYNIVNKYVAPVIQYTYKKEKEEMISRLKSHENNKIWICGDAQYDSPGYCAKYAIYSIMNLLTNEIIDYELVQKGQIQGDLEKAACDTVLSHLDQEIKINLFLSDRHRGIRLLLRTKFNHIDHQFDVWHMAKNLSKKLKAAAGKSKALDAWKSSIVNHLWWSAQTCEASREVLEEKYKSVLKHIANIHEWQSDGDFKHVHRCEHGPLSQEKIQTTLWIAKESPDYHRLQEILLNKTFLADLRHINQYCHTGGLESYHNLRLKYTPKRIHYTYQGMAIRSMLAILDHNNSVRFKEKNNKPGRDGQRFSKSQKSGFMYLYAKTTTIHGDII